MKLVFTLGTLALSLSVFAEKTYQYKDISADAARPFVEKEREPGSVREKEQAVPQKQRRPAKTIEETIQDLRERK